MFHRCKVDASASSSANDGGNGTTIAEATRERMQGRTRFMRVLSAAAIAAMTALVAWGCASSADSSGSAESAESTGSAESASPAESTDSASSVPESVFQITDLYAMNPEDIGPYLESRGYAFLSADLYLEAADLTHEDLFMPMSEGLTDIAFEEPERPRQFYNVWWPSIAADTMSNPEAYGDSYLSPKDILETVKSDDGYAATIYFSDGRYTDEELGESGPLVDLLHRMDETDLANGQKPFSVSMTIYDFNHWGEYFTVGDYHPYTEARTKMLELTGLPQPLGSYAIKDANDAVTACSMGVCDADGTECIYTLNLAGHEATLTIADADSFVETAVESMGYEGISSPEEYIEARINLVDSQPLPEGSERIE